MRELEFIAAVKGRFSGKLDESKQIDILHGECHPFVVEEQGCEVGCMYLYFDPNMIPAMVSIVYLKAYRPNHGIGRKMLNMLCKLADEKGVRLYLEPWPDKGSSFTRKQLVSWYRRNGFEGEYVLERPPRT